MLITSALQSSLRNLWDLCRLSAQMAYRPLPTDADQVGKVGGREVLEDMELISLRQHERSSIGSESVLLPEVDGDQRGIGKWALRCLLLQHASRYACLSNRGIHQTQMLRGTITV